MGKRTIAQCRARPASKPTHQNHHQNHEDTPPSGFRDGKRCHGVMVGSRSGFGVPGRRSREGSLLSWTLQESLGEWAHHRSGNRRFIWDDGAACRTQVASGANAITISVTVAKLWAIRVNAPKKLRGRHGKRQAPPADSENPIPFPRIGGEISFCRAAFCELCQRQDGWGRAEIQSSTRVLKPRCSRT
jgi:hypothetical protein